MEPTREQDSRNGPLPIISVGERKRVQPPTGFEGMNYEQKRRPYKMVSSNNSPEDKREECDNHNN